MNKIILSLIGVLVISGLIALTFGVAKADTVSVSNTNTNTNANANTNVINIGSGTASGSSKAAATVTNPVDEAVIQPVCGNSDPCGCNPCGGSNDGQTDTHSVTVSNTNANANSNANANAINIGSGSATADADADADIEIDSHSGKGHSGDTNANSNANANANAVKVAGKPAKEHAKHVDEQKTPVGKSLPQTGAAVTLPLLFSGIGTGVIALIRRKNASFDYLLNA